MTTVWRRWWLQYMFCNAQLQLPPAAQYSYNIIHDTYEVNNLHDNQGHRINWKITELLNAEDLNSGEIAHIQDTIHNLEDTKAEKIAAGKFFIKLRLGVDKLNKGLPASHMPSLCNKVVTS